MVRPLDVFQFGPHNVMVTAPGLSVKRPLAYLALQEKKQKDYYIHIKPE